ncbi:helix-turn-helix domain-containing protein [Rhizobium nepotum]|uniref:helix-turn-helix domain-containing protein n=1 Tax=Rhizobium nepotum TaxID=1035271 RepID=UPI003CF43D64
MIVLSGKTTPSTHVIRHRDFAKRLGQACENHPHAPHSHGRQIWLKNQIEELFNEVVSREAVRKWFSGEAKPKPKMMSLVARVLSVDEAWLALGVSPNTSNAEKRKKSALATGVANLVAAQIQLAQGSIAFPEDDSTFDLYAIVKGQQQTLSVRLGETSADFVVNFPLELDVPIVVLRTEEPTVFRFFRITEEAYTEGGKVRGDYLEIECSYLADRLLVGNREVPEIVDFTNLNGVVQAHKAR